MKARDGMEGPALHPTSLPAKTHPAQMPITLRSGKPGLDAPLKNIKSAMKLEREMKFKLGGGWFAKDDTGWNLDHTRFCM